MKCRMVLQSISRGIFFLYNYFDLHLMSEQEMDITDLWLWKVLLVYLFSRKLMTLTLDGREA